MEKILFYTLILISLFSCKKKYNCQCVGNSVHEEKFIHTYIITDKKKSNANLTCIKKTDSEYLSDSTVVVVNCDLK